MERTKKPIDREYAFKQVDLGIREATSDNARLVLNGIKDFLKALPGTNETIDREVALAKALEISNGTSHEGVLQMECNLATFLLVLPSPEDLREHVYCTECGNFSLEGEELSCPYADLCDFWDPEDSKPRRVRWCYTGD